MLDDLKTELTPLMIAESIYVVNIYAKKVPEPDYLYQLKYGAIEKLLAEKKAQKVCLHRFKRVHQSHNQYFPLTKLQRIFVLVACENYYFHYPASDADLKSLRYQDHDPDIRNPFSSVKYYAAKRNILQYLGRK